MDTLDSLTLLNRRGEAVYYAASVSKPTFANLRDLVRSLPLARGESVVAALWGEHAEYIRSDSGWAFAFISPTLSEVRKVLGNGLAYRSVSTGGVLVLRHATRPNEWVVCDPHGRGADFGPCKGWSATSQTLKDLIREVQATTLVAAAQGQGDQSLPARVSCPHCEHEFRTLVPAFPGQEITLACPICGSQFAVSWRPVFHTRLLEETGKTPAKAA